MTPGGQLRVRDGDKTISERSARRRYGTSAADALEALGHTAEQVERKDRYFAFRGSHRERRAARDDRRSDQALSQAFGCSDPFRRQRSDPARLCSRAPTPAQGGRAHPGLRPAALAADRWHAAPCIHNDPRLMAQRSEPVRLLVTRNVADDHEPSVGHAAPAPRRRDDQEGRAAAHPLAGESVDESAARTVAGTARLPRALCARYPLKAKLLNAKSAK